MGIVYRLRQFWGRLLPRELTDENLAEIQAHLKQDEVDIFNLYSPSEKQHGYQVLKTLKLAGYEQPDLLAAALLHDIGKTRFPLSIWERAIVVIGGKLIPRKATHWGRGEPRGWKRPFVVKAKHPAWGGEMMQVVGSSPLTISLIRRHQELLPETEVSEEEKLLKFLQWADNQH